MKRVAALFLAGALFASATNAQDTDVLLQSTSSYAQSRAVSGGRYILSPEQAADRLLSADKTLVLDLRSAESAEKLRVKNAQRYDFAGLFSYKVLGEFQKNEPIIVVDDGSHQSVEAMVLLRLLGYQVFAVSGGIVPLAQSIKNLAATNPGASAAVGETLEGIELPSLGGQTLPPPFWEVLPPWVLSIMGVLPLIVVGMLVWFMIIQPRRRARSLHQAAKLLEGGSDAALAEAEALLTDAVGAGLRPPDLKEARFLLAYVRARRGRYTDALIVLKDSVPHRDSSPEALYLDLWLKIQDKSWEEAERRWFEHSSVISEILQGKELGGIVYLELGRQQLARREYEKALQHFDKVRDLDVLSNQLPEHLTNLELVLALSALFEETGVEQARARFETAMSSAESEQRSSLLSRIGLLLCEWRGESFPDIDAQLADLLNEIRKGADENGEKSEEAELLPHIVLWHVISLFYQWLLRLPQQKGLPAKQRKDLDTRLELVRTKMPDAGDADLIDGLLSYYLAQDDPERQLAVELLRKAIKLGVTLPEILYLVQCEDRLAELSKNRLGSYIVMLKAYLADPAHPVELRQELYEHLHQFERFRQLEDMDVKADESAMAATLHDVIASCELIKERVQRIFRGTADYELRTGVESLLDDLSESRDGLHKNLTALGKTEQKLMRVGGEALLREEEDETGETVETKDGDK